MGLHSLALGSDGRVRAWGANYWGQLGDGTTNSKTLPMTLPGLTNVVMVSAGTGHSLATMANSSVWQWGMTVTGAISTPAQVP